jgi:uncharacterized protein (DUF433 family)
MNWRERVELNPQVLLGKPVIKGTRIAVELIIELLAEGWTEKQILEEYPTLCLDDIRAAVHYAAETLKAERVYPIA